MPSLQERLASILSDALPVEQEPDGALTLRHNGTLASLRVVNIAEDLDLVSLTQILAWDLPLTKKVSDQVARHARDTNLGTVTLLEKFKLKPEFKETDGGHTWINWQEYLNEFAPKLFW